MRVLYIYIKRRVRVSCIERWYVYVDCTHSLGMVKDNERKDLAVLFNFSTLFSVALLDFSVLRFFSFF